MKFDDASWHYDSIEHGDDDERWARAACHIGIYLKWCFSRGWAGELHMEESDSAEAVQLVRDGEMTGTQFLLTFCDGKFTTEDLNEHGNAFASAHYESTYTEHADAFVLEADCDYDRLATTLDAAFMQWSTGA